MGHELTFEKEFDFFVAHQEELVAQYAGKVLAIKGDKILGVYSSPLEAYLETQKINPPGSFMLQPCLPGPDAYTTTISSSLILSA